MNEAVWLKGFAVLLLSLAAFASGFSSPVAEEDGKTLAGANLPRVEKGICLTNLDQVGQAIRAYRQAHKRLPDRLSDLLPGFLADPEVLNCPTSRRTGKTSYAKAGYAKAEITDPKTTYLYEFRTNAIPKIIGGGSRRSMREWKQLQMGLLGSDVPLVRCLMHDSNLNLPFAGNVYQCKGDWELRFASLVNPEELSFSRLFSQGAPLRVISITPRTPQTPASLVDLSAFYNASLTQCWSREAPCQALTNLATGIRTLNGVPFDVRGLIQLNADAAWLDVYPVAAPNIAVGLRGQRLHFLHGTIRREKPEKEIGSYLIRYENGETRSIPILYGVQVADWRPQPTDTIKGSDSRIAWQETNELARASGAPAVLYQTRWENPLPGVQILSLDFRSAGTESGPFLVAVTVEP